MVDNSWDKSAWPSPGRCCATVERLAAEREPIGRPLPARGAPWVTPSAPPSADHVGERAHVVRAT